MFRACSRVLALLLLAPLAFSASVRLQWDANTESDLAGYRVHIGLVSGAYTETRDAGARTNFVWDGLIANTAYFFVVTAYNTAGLESLYSNEVAYRFTEDLLPNPAGYTVKTNLFEHVFFDVR